MHLTSAVMDTIIKYPCDSLTMMKEKQKPKHERNLLKKKIGYFQSEQEQFAIIKNNTGTRNTRNPLCFLLEAADDLAYTLLIWRMVITKDYIHIKIYWMLSLKLAMRKEKRY